MLTLTVVFVLLLIQILVNMQETGAHCTGFLFAKSGWTHICGDKSI